jgi:hypothetical protein
LALSGFRFCSRLEHAVQPLPRPVAADQCEVQGTTEQSWCWVDPLPTMGTVPMVVMALEMETIQCGTACYNGSVTNVLDKLKPY